MLLVLHAIREVLRMVFAQRHLQRLVLLQVFFLLFRFVGYLCELLSLIWWIFVLESLLAVGIYCFNWHVLACGEGFGCDDTITCCIYLRYLSWLFLERHMLWHKIWGFTSSMVASLILNFDFWSLIKMTSDSIIGYINRIPWLHMLIIVIFRHVLLNESLLRSHVYREVSELLCRTYSWRLLLVHFFRLASYFLMLSLLELHGPIISLLERA